MIRDTVSIPNPVPKGTQKLLPGVRVFRNTHGRDTRTNYFDYRLSLPVVVCVHLIYLEFSIIFCIPLQHVRLNGVRGMLGTIKYYEVKLPCSP